MFSISRALASKQYYVGWIHFLLLIATKRFLFMFLTTPYRVQAATEQGKVPSPTLSLWPLIPSHHFSAISFNNSEVVCNLLFLTSRRSSSLEWQGGARKASRTISLVTPSCFGLGVTWSCTLRPQINHHFKPGWFCVMSGAAFDLIEWLVVGEQGLRRVKRLPVLRDYFSEVKNIWSSLVVSWLLDCVQLYI